MAVWQFDFFIIPEEAVNEKEYHNQHYMNLRNSEDNMFWNGYNLSESSIVKISEILKEIKSWSENIKQLGSIEETCIKMLFDNNRLIEVSVRLDLRSLTPDILMPIIDFIKENNALIVTSNGMVLRPVIEDFIRELKKSEAYSFISNPEQFLASLSR